MDIDGETDRLVHQLKLRKLPRQAILERWLVNRLPVVTIAMLGRARCRRLEHVCARPPVVWAGAGLGTPGTRPSGMRGIARILHFKEVGSLLAVVGDDGRCVGLPILFQPELLRVETARGGHERSSSDARA